MGSYLSCTLSSRAGGGHSRSRTVILPGGKLRRLEDGPVKAAELMLETPNHFVVEARSLHVGRRISALNADQDLPPANAYVMLPMKRLNSIATDADVGLAGKRSDGGGGMSVRILPESQSTAAPPVDVSQSSSPEAAAAATPKLNNMDVDGGDDLSEMKHRLSFGKSKKPLLETIAEEPVRLRQMSDRWSVRC